MQQSEQHFGPHSDWFWDVEQSGGGVLMDMGCHADRVLPLDPRQAGRRSRSRRELGTYVHGGRTRGEDHAIVDLEFDGQPGRAWSRRAGRSRGGMDDRAEIFGSQGVTYADLLRGSSLHTYSEVGYGYAVEKAPDTRGWTFTMFEELWNYGFPQEMQHFVTCVRTTATPLETGEDGRAVLEILYAMYRAAGGAGRAVLPLELTPEEAAAGPIEGWRR